MPDEIQRFWRRLYLRQYRQEQKALRREKALQRERAAVKRAVRRLATVERWESEHPGEVDEKLLHLRWHLGQVFAEEAVKAKEQKKKRKREAGAGVLKKSVSENEGLESVP